MVHNISVNKVYNVKIQVHRDAAGEKTTQLTVGHPVKVAQFREREVDVWCRRYHTAVHNITNQIFLFTENATLL